MNRNAEKQQAWRDKQKSKKLFREEKQRELRIFLTKALEGHLEIEHKLDLLTIRHLVDCIERGTP